jgi:hypothetical protein
MHQSHLTRRRALATAAWGTPAIVVASAAPAYAGSMTPPAIVVSDLVGVRSSSGVGGLIDVSATFTNSGGAAASLTTTFEWVLVGTGLVTSDVTNVSSPWAHSDPSSSGGIHQGTFTRAGGLAAGASDTLTFSFQSNNGSGTITAGAPITTPSGANAGTAGTWGDTELVDMDVTNLSNPIDNGNIFVSIRNNGAAAVATQSVAVTITPTTGTFALSGGGGASNSFSASPANVPATSAPITITFTRTNVPPLAAGGSLSFNFTITQDGTGDLSATVTDPDEGNNNTLTGTYL